MGTSEDLQRQLLGELRRLSSLIEGALGEDGQVGKNKSQIGKNTADIRVWKRVSWLVLIGFVTGFISLVIKAAVS